MVLKNGTVVYERHGLLVADDRDPMTRGLIARGWDERAAREQAELWARGVRDIRIADDTFGVYEEIRYESF